MTGTTTRRDCPATPARSPANWRRSTARLRSQHQESSPAARPGRSFSAIRSSMIRTAEEDERLEAWRRAAAEAQPDPPLLAAALLWDAWESNPPLARQAWLGPLLVSATLRERRKTRAHLACVNLGLRCVPREKRRSPERVARLAAFLRSNRGRGGGGNEGP